ncbi:hypothetical protein IWQ47_003486 [Aquimarina sp. EL_43]|uniref:hypothetical protein n=1 Tax=unclassified Aquimarina TaxID=2627091 RepID=UPI0018CB65B6|nr:MULTISPECIES: hypothetical protein [unclassified Aquimarina]MBG6131772.1 hypothetical protein [Aquimarina sp. EL_35]MBG6149336.1 hypothetical protein [Aquimarina sp. EL_32]MBG6170401.1 hypothetical protein [Aquimarina sp. EL_43]
MNISLFNILIGNQRYGYTINAEKSSVIQELQYFVDEKYTNDPWYTGTISNETFALKKVVKKINIPLDFSYKVFGKFEGKEIKCHINYRVTFSNYFIKHLSVCIVPTLMLIYIFLHYNQLYLLIPLIYFLISDLVFNIRKYFFNKRNNDHFTFFLKTIEKKLQD